MKKKGIYIVFEGIVGSGKSTQSKLLFERLKKEFPKREIVWTKEPGGSEIADAIRKVVQGTKFQEEMEPVCEQYLYAASRAQTLRKIVAPVIGRGGVVVSDRSYFTSITNQGFGRKLGEKVVLKINKVAVSEIKPDLVVIIDLPISVSLKRVSDKAGDKFETLGKTFYERVRKGYQFIARKYKKFVVVIDGSGSVNEVATDIHQKVIKLLHG